MQNLQNIGSERAIPPTRVPDTDEIIHLIEGLPPDSELVLHGQSWEMYEALMDELIDPAGLHSCFDGETIQIMATSSAHDQYARFLDRFVGELARVLNIDVEFFGSATIKID